MLGGSQSRSGCFGEEKNLLTLPILESLTVPPDSLVNLFWNTCVKPRPVIGVQLSTVKNTEAFSETGHEPFLVRLSKRLFIVIICHSPAQCSWPLTTHTPSARCINRRRDRFTFVTWSHWMGSVIMRGVSDGSHSGMCLGGTRFEFHLRPEYPDRTNCVFIYLCHCAATQTADILLAHLCFLV